MSILDCQQVGLAYSGQRVLADISLTFKSCAVHAIVGPSGCGKSSFLHCCNRLYEHIPGAAMQGQVFFQGRDIHAADSDLLQLRRNVAMIFQKPTPFPCSIADNLAIPLREHGCKSRDERSMRSQHVLQAVGLWDEVKDRLKQSAARLSGGQQQRLCLARALVLEPQVLLLDEPCSALDPLATGRIEELIKGLRRDYCVVLVSHNLAQARRLADHIAVFWQRDGVGRCIESGAAADIFDNPQSAEAQQYFSGVLG